MDCCVGAKCCIIDKERNLETDFHSDTMNFGKILYHCFRANSINSHDVWYFLKLSLV